jgi:hypothetical protein
VRRNLLTAQNSKPDGQKPQILKKKLVKVIENLHYSTCSSAPGSTCWLASPHRGDFMHFSMSRDILDFSELKLRHSLRDSPQTQQTKEESEETKNAAKRERIRTRTEPGAVDRVAPSATSPIHRVEKPNRFGRYPNISEPDRETDRERTNP